MGQWAPLFERACERMGENVNTIDVFKADIEAAGFRDVYEKWYKAAIGERAKNPALKEWGGIRRNRCLRCWRGILCK